MCLSRQYACLAVGLLSSTVIFVTVITLFLDLAIIGQPCPSLSVNNNENIKGTDTRTAPSWLRLPCRWSPRKWVHRRLPVLGWWRQYGRAAFTGDLVAGLSVGLMTVPQALAYSIVAGLPPNYGLYSAFMGSFLYVLMGTTEHLSIGPTAVMGLLTKLYTSQGGPDYAVLLAFVSGMLELLAAVINLGFLVNFISHPVISGFCSAAAVTIISSQVKALLGLKLRTHGVFDVWVQIFTHITETRWQDCVLGLFCIFLLTTLKNLVDIKKCASRVCGASSPEEGATSCGRCQKGVLFVLSIGRNALVVLLASIIAIALPNPDSFTLTGFVEPGLPLMQLPPFSPTVGNRTVTFMEAMQDVGVGVVVLPFIAVLDNIAIIQSVYPGRAIDTTQEITVLAFINIFGSFFGSMPTTASLSRTAINKSSGGRTPAAGIVTGIMVLMALAFLTPAFRWIPKSSLAAVIMCAVVHMIDAHLAVVLWRTSRKDLLVLAVTFVSCLAWGVEWGVLVGAGLHLLMVLFGLARPGVKITVGQTGGGHEFVLAQPGHGVLYPSIGQLRARVERAGRKKGRGSLPVVVDCSFLQNIDYTAGKGLVNLSKDFHGRQQRLVYINMPAHVRNTVIALQDDKTFPINILECPGAVDSNTLTLNVLDCFLPNESSSAPAEYQMIPVDQWNGETEPSNGDLSTPRSVPHEPSSNHHTSNSNLPSSTCKGSPAATDHRSSRNSLKVTSSLEQSFVDGTTHRPTSASEDAATALLHR